MSIRDDLIRLCLEGMKARGVAESPLHKAFLKAELADLDVQLDHEYFVDQKNKGLRYPRNENNLIIPWLLGIVDDFNVGAESVYHPIEFPDIDVDYLPVIQEYLRNTWAPKTFGRDRVVNIGNYGTFGIKSALLDMARVHGADRNEIQEITKNLDDKDDDGKPLTWDSALAITPALQAYCQEHPDIAIAAKSLIGRNKNRGKHAGGTVISSKKIDDLVPLMVDTDFNPVSGWTEGLHEQDLAPVGLIKFDVLAIKDLLRIAATIHLIKQRHPEVTAISALPGASDWTDTSYLNDKKALALANKAQLKGIFQFDSKGIRNLVRSGGVDSFEDLVAYTALFRPGPLGMGMQERFVARKKKEEEWESSCPAIIKSILSKTYGVMAYQEDVMKILHYVGDIPLVQCESLRKAISKKKEKQFAKAKGQFLENGSKIIGWPIEPTGPEDTQNMRYLWDQIASFAEYGFNRSHAVAYTYISSRLLWLKAHFPLEFYTVTQQLVTDSEKNSALKRDGEKLGLEFIRLDLNKSGVTWSVVDDKIYIGFSNVKGIGEEVAKRIVDGQPYKGFEDFLNRFGTDKRIVDPLIALSKTSNIFTDAEPHVLEEFYEHYKSRSKGRRDREKRQMKRREELLGTIQSLLPDVVEASHDWVMSCYKSGHLKSPVAVEDADSVWAWIKKYGKSVTDFERKEGLDNDNPVELGGFTPTGTVDPNKFSASSDLENEHYGFCWQHPLQLSPDYVGEHAFDRFDDEGIITTGIEVMIVKKPQQKESRKGNRYYYVLVEDEDSNREVVTFWDNDYDRFKEELEYWDEKAQRGHLLKLRLTKPGPGFKSYTFYAPPKHERHFKVAKNKEDDERLTVMRPPVFVDVLNSLRGT